MTAGAFRDPGAAIALTVIAACAAATPTFACMPPPPPPPWKRSAVIYSGVDAWTIECRFGDAQIRSFCTLQTAGVWVRSDGDSVTRIIVAQAGDIIDTPGEPPPPALRTEIVCATPPPAPCPTMRRPCELRGDAAEQLLAQMRVAPSASLEMRLRDGPIFARRLLDLSRFAAVWTKYLDMQREHIGR